MEEAKREAIREVVENFTGLDADAKTFIMGFIEGFQQGREAQDGERRE